MKRKQLRAELSLSTGLKAEYDPSSPEHDASLGSGDQSLDLSGFPKESQCDWQDLADLGEPSGHAMSTGVKLEEEANGYRVRIHVFVCALLICELNKGNMMHNKNS